MKLILALAAITLGAQTKTTLDQQRAPTAAVERVIIAMPDGTMKPLELGPGLAIIDGKLAVTAAQDFLVTVSQTKLMRNPDGSYPSIPNAIYSRGGITQTVGVDYLLVPGKVAPLVPWPAEDVVTATAVTAIPMRAVPAPVRPTRP